MKLAPGTLMKAVRAVMATRRLEGIGSVVERVMKGMTESVTAVSTLIPISAPKIAITP